MPYTVRTSVRPLVEYVFRGGSLQSGTRFGSALQEGTRIHREVQEKYGENDRKEVFLKTELVCAGGELTIQVEGRCDGLLLDESGLYTIDEIKSTSELPEQLDGGHDVHWAQAKFYAYMLAEERGAELERIGVRLTYVHKPGGERSVFEVVQTREELTAFVEDVAERYAPYALLLKRREEKRNLAASQLGFPFGRYREGQRLFAGAVFKTIREEKNLLARAPTGTGKTISTLFPAVKAIGEGLVGRVYYLTAKTTTRAGAEEALALLERSGAYLSAVTITAKDKVCFKEEEDCAGGQCRFALGYYDRINDALLDLFEHETLITRDVLETYARKHTVCPFEFSLDAAYAADVVVCDYNYVFDPRIAFKRLSDEQRNSSALLVDEAHNLVERGREMFSAELVKSAFLAIKRGYKNVHEGVRAAADRVNAYLILLRKQAGEEGKFVGSEPPEVMFKLLEPFVEQAENALITVHGSESEEELLEAYFAAQTFLRIGKLYGDPYVTYVETDGSEVKMKMFCLDPSELLLQASKNYRSAVYFSATLAPLGFYREMLGASEEDYTLSIPSPFSPEQLETRILPVSTRFRDRERTRESLAVSLAETVLERPGNYLFFFPSYAYLQEIRQAFEIRIEGADVEILNQDAGMSESERTAFLDAFVPGRERTLVGFAVMGGVFSEGIDLAGDRLTGVAVVGVGLPQIGLERDIIRDYFNEHGRSGFNYAYVYPGMNKVQQAGGRLIRTEDDRGVLILADDRFLQEPYRSLLPEEWGMR
ncbi:helicase C-terminal domain-containing protein [Saccharibacillus sp. CPCC 101409]|uniref:helicase C-terminal domain-containing protein n=1 Tax=Saccharibacillus sp. CPCC 101409 TaxID=3058041 RepID=UPI002672B294|nr:helicase C-terminal domain-containing protein [Saccharibacillus sp. CPCC 101409]MDO3410109.1 helicase C-terminal domain-containing protein [Saccharibacillus sp. CPCC 101409]